MGSRAQLAGLVTLVIIAAVAVYIQSQGGLGRLFASGSWDRIPKIKVPQTIDQPDPGVTGPSNHDSPDGFALFANPIAAADGGDGTFIPPMSATSGGAVKISQAQISANDGTIFRDGDKGLLFITLPASIGKQPAPRTGDTNIGAAAATGQDYPNVLDWFRDFLTPRADAPAPRTAVSF